ncbi:MAG: PIN domain-containing protein [Propionibacteriaceae bacterium]|jgi:toxin-antitoxin system PIN domain toxin|nr:PIN domain-containing protein [Propionibacteriaceae bacterium]
MTVLLDANVLVALAVPAHVHHQAAARWLDDLAEPYATCPITEGALVRFAVREGAPAADAVRLVAGLAVGRRQEFWADDVPFGQVRLTGVIGHRQVTDAYLAQLARRHGGRLATFDQGLAAQHPDVAWLIPPAAG